MAIELLSTDRGIHIYRETYPDSANDCIIAVHGEPIDVDSPDAHDELYKRGRFPHPAGDMNGLIERISFWRAGRPWEQ